MNEKMTQRQRDDYEHLRKLFGKPECPQPTAEQIAEKFWEKVGNKYNSPDKLGQLALDLVRFTIEQLQPKEET